MKQDMRPIVTISVPDLNSWYCQVNELKKRVHESRGEWRERMSGRKGLLEAVYIGNFTPEQECPMTGGLVLLRRQVLVAAAENIVDLGMRRQETLGLARGFVSAHLPLPLPGRLVRDLGPVVESLVLPMLYPRQDLRLRGAVTLYMDASCLPRFFRVLLDRLGCSFISGLIAGVTCWPRWNPLIHSSFELRAVRPKSYSGLMNPGLTCLPSHSITLRNLSTCHSFHSKTRFWFRHTCHVFTPACD